MFRLKIMNIKISLPGVTFNNLVYNGAGSFQYLDFQWTAFGKARNFKGLPALTLKTNSWNSKHTSDFWNKIVFFDPHKNWSINCVGLQGPNAVEISRKIHDLANEIDLPLIGSVSGDNIDEFVKNTKLISTTPVQAIELNLSCPNLDKKVIFATDTDLTFKCIQACREVTSKPLYVKLTPNVTDIVTIAKTAESAGANVLVVNNTYYGLILNENFKPKVLKACGGFSGAGVLPITLANIYRISQAVSIPIIACGGIISANDVLQAIACGATVCQVVTGSAENVNFFENINKEVKELLLQHKITDLDLFRGSAWKQD